MRRAMLLVALLLPAAALAGKGDLLIGIDDKAGFEPSGQVARAGGGDSLQVLDISDPAHPRIRASLPLMNSLLGPPTNLEITPDGKLGLLANSVTTAEKDGKWQNIPDDKLFVIDLEANPPALVDTVVVGKQPSGLDIARAGNLALVANRASKDVSVLTVENGRVRLVDTVAVGDPAAAVAIAPDGRRAFVVKNTVHKIGVLTLDGAKATYDAAMDIPVGYGVYNVDVTPDGRWAIAANTGIGGDGNVDTLTVIDAAANPPRAIDHVVVGDGPEGLAISPDGQWVAVPLLEGSVAPQTAWSYSRNGSVLLLKIGEGGKLSIVDKRPAGAVPEGVAFSPDSRYLYVGNFADKTLQIFAIVSGKLKEVAEPMALPGQPASLRGGPVR